MGIWPGAEMLVFAFDSEHSDADCLVRGAA
jgi:hypothetical protein